MVEMTGTLKVLQNGKETTFVEDSSHPEELVVTYNRMNKAGKVNLRSGQFYLRGLVHTLVFNNKDHLLLTVRSRGRFAGQTDIGISETRKKDESLEETARRGLEEELGIPRQKQGALIPLALGLHTSSDALISIVTSGIRYNGRLSIDRSEISRAYFVPLGRVLQESRNYTPTSLQSWLHQILQYRPEWLVARMQENA